MKKILVFVFIVLGFLLVGCQESVPQVELLYSGSYSDSDVFDEPIQYIESYQDYLASDYPLDLEATYFETHMLYTYYWMNNTTGQDLFDLNNYVVEGDRLTIFYKEVGALAGDAFSHYAMIFSIDKALDIDIYRIKVKEVYSFDDISLIYSQSDEYSTGEYPKQPTFIEDYETYQSTHYTLGLEASFFDDYMLYTYAFNISVTSRDLYLFEDYTIFGDILILNCVENPHLVSPAFSVYEMVFVISKEIYNQVDQIQIDLFGKEELPVIGYEEILPLANRIYYFEITEQTRFGMYFESYDEELMEDILTGHLYNVDTETEVDVDEYIGSFGFFTVLDPGNYVLMLNISDPLVETRYYIQFGVTMNPVE